MKSSTENIYKQKVNQVIDYINSNLHQPLQLNVIADIVNMSQRQLLRMMSSALNEPLYAYVARQRIERAVLYMQTEVSIRPGACLFPSSYKIKSQTCFVWLLIL